MEIGLVGLGKMGANMRDRLRSAGHVVVGYSRDPAASDAPSLAGVAAALAAPRAVWVMVPAGDATHQVIIDLADVLDAGDVVIDGGNTRWTDDIAHAEMLAEREIGFVDVGVSGGIWGRENGYALMVGGDGAHVTRLQPAFDALKPEGDFGFVHAGKVGAGHFAKMVHNGIEYALMQSYAEGFELLAAADVVDNVPEVLRSWRAGTVIRSWLLDLLVEALDDDPRLESIEGYAADSGEGRWTVQAAIDHGVAVPAISAALFARFVSQQDQSPAMKGIAAMRAQFGGHAVRSAGGAEPALGDAPHVEPAEMVPSEGNRQAEGERGVQDDVPDASQSR